MGFVQQRRNQKSRCPSLGGLVSFACKWKYDESRQETCGALCGACGLPVGGDTCVACGIWKLSAFSGRTRCYTKEINDMKTKTVSLDEETRSVLHPMTLVLAKKYYTLPSP